MDFCGFVRFLFICRTKITLSAGLELVVFVYRFFYWIDEFRFFRCRFFSFFHTHFSFFLVFRTPTRAFLLFRTRRFCLAFNDITSYAHMHFKRLADKNHSHLARKNENRGKSHKSNAQLTTCAQNMLPWQNELTTHTHIGILFSSNAIFSVRVHCFKYTHSMCLAELHTRPSENGWETKNVCIGKMSNLCV